jgi:hypothetical protein
VMFFLVKVNMTTLKNVTFLSRKCCIGKSNAHFGKNPGAQPPDRSKTKMADVRRTAMTASRVRC